MSRFPSQSPDTIELLESIEELKVVSPEETALIESLESLVELNHNLDKLDTLKVNSNEYMKVLKCIVANYENFIQKTPYLLEETKKRISKSCASFLKTTDPLNVKFLETSEERVSYLKHMSKELRDYNNMAKLE